MRLVASRVQCTSKKCVVEVTFHLSLPFGESPSWDSAAASSPAHIRRLKASCPHNQRRASRPILRPHLTWGLIFDACMLTYQKWRTNHVSTKRPTVFGMKPGSSFASDNREAANASNSINAHPSTVGGREVCTSVMRGGRKVFIHAHGQSERS